MLNVYCQNVLAMELKKADYDGLSADLAWIWLMLPATSTSQVDTHVMLTPLAVAGVLGPLKAEALAARTKIFLPTIADHLMTVGVDASAAATATFLNALVDGSTVLQTDVATLLALGKQAVSITTPRRFDLRFDPRFWPHVAGDGTIGTSEDQAIHGFPNDLARADFDAAWAASGRI